MSGEEVRVSEPQALVALLEQAEKACLEEYEQRRNSFVWAKTAERWKAKAEGIRYAIDTAAAMEVQK